MCLDSKAMRSYAAAKGWESRRRRDRATPFEEGGTNYMTAGGGAKEEGGAVGEAHVPHPAQAFTAIGAQQIVLRSCPLTSPSS